jgi:glycosyltransferase involved in cell wall biosynthesis
MLETYQSSYPSIKSKSHLIYNGIDSLPIVKNDNAKVDVNAKLKFFYAGSFYFNSAHPRDMFVLLEVLLQLFNQNKIPFFEVHIASNLTEEERAKFQNGPYAAHIILLGLLGQSEVDAYFQNVNCCLLILGNSQQDKSAIPIKVFEYFVSQLPILALVPQQAEIVALGGYYSGFGACYYDQDLKQNMQNVLAWLEKCNKIDSCELKQDKWSDFNRKSNTEQLVKVFQL